jgi:hypothetical protein
MVTTRPADGWERRLTRVTTIAERFMYDLGVMLSGQRDLFDDYVSAGALAALRSAIEPFLQSGTSFQPDFGEYAQLTVAGSLADVGEPVTAWVDFEDRSRAHASDGTLVAVPRRSLRLTLVIDATVQTVIGHQLELVSA